MLMAAVPPWSDQVHCLEKSSALHTNREANLGSKLTTQGQLRTFEFEPDQQSEWPCQVAVRVNNVQSQRARRHISLIS